MEIFKNNLHREIIFRKIFIFLIVIFIAWISLFGETFQRQFKNITLLGLLVLLSVSFIYKKPKKITAVDLFLIFYFLFTTLSLFFSENRLAAYEWYRRYILPFPLIFFAMRNINKKFIFSMTLSFCIFGCIILTIGISEFIFNKNIIYESWMKNVFYYRFIYNRAGIMSTLLHPTVFGSFLLGCFPFLFFLISQTQKIYKTVIKFYIATYILAIIFSFSKGNRGKSAIMTQEQWWELC